mmetsp:Transcript_2907/g.8203  ORF Transcript_2907/g.8203 Transcript_2907/m.8203 type:complete len:222 (+) Transcript_2907:1092-1757(+)
MIPEGITVIEQQQNDHLVCGHVQLVLLSSKVGPQVSGSHVGLPVELPPRMRCQVELFEVLTASLKLTWKIALTAKLCWPRAGRQHLHRKLNAVKIRSSAIAMHLVIMHSVSACLYVCEHALQLAGELITTFSFQLDKQHSLRVIRNSPPRQQTLGQVLFVILLKHILLLEESEEHHDFIQHNLCIIFSHSLKTSSQLVIHEQGDELRRSQVQVDEVLKCLI